MYDTHENIYLGYYPTTQCQPIVPPSPENPNGLPPNPQVGGHHGTPQTPQLATHHGIPQISQEGIQDGTPAAQIQPQAMVYQNSQNLPVPSPTQNLSLPSPTRDNPGLYIHPSTFAPPVCMYPPPFLNSIHIFPD